MSFSTITELTNYIDVNINANGMRNITGFEMNAALNGIIQFLPVAGIYTQTLSITSGTVFTINIPLTFTPSSAVVQVYNPLAVATTGIIVYSNQYTANGIVVQLQTAGLSGMRTISLNYIAFR